MSAFMESGWGLLTILGGCVGGTIAIALLIVTLTGPPTCDAQTRGMLIAHRWSFMGGCQVQSRKDGWLPLENYRAID